MAERNAYGGHRGKAEAFLAKAEGVGALDAAAAASIAAAHATLALLDEHNRPGGTRITALRDRYIAEGGEPDLLPQTLTEAERAGFLDGLATAARLLTRPEVERS